MSEQITVEPLDPRELLATLRLMLKQERRPSRELKRQKLRRQIAELERAAAVKP